MRIKKSIHSTALLLSFSLFSTSAFAVTTAARVYKDDKGAQVTIVPYKAAGDDKALVEVSGLPLNNPWNAMVSVETMYEGKDPASLTIMLSAQDKPSLQVSYRGNPELLTAIYQSESGPVMYMLNLNQKASKKVDVKALIARRKQ